MPEGLACGRTTLWAVRPASTQRCGSPRHHQRREGWPWRDGMLDVALRRRCLTKILGPLEANVAGAPHVCGAEFVVTVGILQVA